MMALIKLLNPVARNRMLPNQKQKDVQMINVLQEDSGGGGECIDFLMGYYSLYRKNNE